MDYKMHKIKKCHLKKCYVVVLKRTVILQAHLSTEKNYCEIQRLRDRCIFDAEMLCCFLLGFCVCVFLFCASAAGFMKLVIHSLCFLYETGFYSENKFTSNMFFLIIKKKKNLSSLQTIVLLHPCKVDHVAQVNSKSNEQCV